jgi:hypothetical protein
VLAALRQGRPAVIGTACFASAENGIGDFFADVGNFHKISASDSDGTRCYARSELDAAVAAAAGAATAPSGENAGAPAAPPASGDASTTSCTTSAPLKVNGNNPAQWQAGTPWQDNLGALFTHAGQSETIYSTSTIDVSSAGTTIIDSGRSSPRPKQLSTPRAPS